VGDSSFPTDDDISVFLLRKMNTFLLIFLAALALYSAIWVGLKYAFYEDELHSEETMWYVEPEPEMSVSSLQLHSTSTIMLLHSLRPKLL
jgi:hypothetical protein